MSWTLSDMARGLRASASAIPAEPAVFTEAQFEPAKPRDVRADYATPRVAGFIALAAQLGGLLLVFYLFHLERRPFNVMSAGIFGAFLIHYWLPFRFKEPFWVAVSVIGAFYLLNPWVAALLFAVGLGLFGILRAPVALRWRVLCVAAVFAVFIYGCATSRIPVPGAFYPVFGAIFMFRIIIYIYDLAYAKEPAQFLPFLSYFFILPNYYFMLFPVVDFKTMRQTYYRRDIHEIAQQGIHWMVRGTVQLMLYRLVLYFNDPYLPDRVNSFGALLSTMVLTFLLYLNVSGSFHVIIGMLHLFGYDLPETHRRYLLADSFLDFWRRINIYWKDFMVKVVYFPVYFKLRKRGDVRAQVLATVVVFLVTWVLHSYQFFWIKRQYILTWPDTIFWGALGLLVIGNVIYSSRHKRRRIDPSWTGRAKHAMQIVGTFATITVLWSLWSSPTVGSWIYLTTHWAQGAQ